MWCGLVFVIGIFECLKYKEYVVCCCVLINGEYGLGLVWIIFYDVFLFLEKDLLIEMCLKLFVFG